MATDITQPTDGVLLDQFVNERNEDAFATLMERHGPYLLAVCKQLTSHFQDAEDVFQACFLELVRKAGGIRQQNSVAGWLHTVAVRLARKARARRLQREARESTAVHAEPAAPAEDLSWRDACRVLQEELAQVPEELRLPIILCLFEGLTQDEAGQALGVNPRTIKDRLKRGRELLRGRLVRRGVTLAILGTLLSATNVQAAISAALQQTTMQGAVAVASKATLAGAVSPAVASLASSSSGVFAWVGAALTVIAVATAGTAYLAWERWPSPAPEAPAPPLFVAIAEAPTARPIGPPPAGRSVQRSFRNKQFDSEFFQWSGPNPKKYVRLEDEGLRITLPAENGPADLVGVKLRYPVRGDFEVEATMQFLDVGRPKMPTGDKGWGAGVTVYFFMDSPNRDGVWFGKMMDPTSPRPLFCGGHRIRSGAERVNKSVKTMPAQHATGPARLRVVRKGAVFTTFFSDGDNDDWKAAHTLDVSDADAVTVRFAADPVWVANIPIDVRLIDFSISAKEIVGYEP